MAGVMAHEISHVALRHGTAQATKASNPGVQLGALGGRDSGRRYRRKTQALSIAQGAQFGLGAYLLKFSREYETQADILGAQILARAGYDPMDLARMFETIEREGGSSGPEWLSSHPNPGKPPGSHLRRSAAITRSAAEWFVRGIHRSSSSSKTHGAGPYSCGN
jgi:predicted Zn-dependent protease